MAHYRIYFAGISPLLTTGLITSFLSTSTIYDMFTSKSVQMTQNEKIKRDCKIQKLLAILLCLFQSTAYVMSGMYGELKVVGTGNATMIVMQVSLFDVILVINSFFSVLHWIVNHLWFLFLSNKISSRVSTLIFTSPIWIANLLFLTDPTDVHYIYQFILLFFIWSRTKSSSNFIPFFFSYFSQG